MGRNNGFYLAVRSNSTGDYGIKFLFDNAGNQAAIALLDQATRSSLGPGLFTVTANGATNGNGILTNVTLAECFPPGSAECDGVCTSTGNGCVGGAQDIDIALSAQPL